MEDSSSPGLGTGVFCCALGPLQKKDLGKSLETSMGQEDSRNFVLFLGGWGWYKGREFRVIAIIFMEAKVGKMTW